MKLIQILIFSLLVIYASSGKIMMTKRVIDVLNVTPCPQNDQLESPMRNVLFRHINRTHTSLSYDCTFKRPIDENVGAIAVIEKFGPSGWVEHPFLPFQPDICNTMNMLFPEQWVSYNVALGIKEPAKCPIPPGNYSMHNFINDMSSVKIPVWEGEMRIKTMFQLADTYETIFCSYHFMKTTEILD